MTEHFCLAEVAYAKEKDYKSQVQVDCSVSVSVSQSVLLPTISKMHRLIFTD